jgi:hypothetical protein
MKLAHLKKWTAIGLSAVMLLALAACSSDDSDSTTTTEPTTAVTDDATEATDNATEATDDAVDETGEAKTVVSFNARFLDSAEEPLANYTIETTVDGESTQYITDDDGMATIPDLPRTGTVELSILDEENTEVGLIELTLADGSITDVAESDDGTYSLTILSSADLVDLTFELSDDGTLACTLAADDSAVLAE